LAFLAVALAQRRPQPQGLSVVKPPPGFKASLGNPIVIVSSNSEMNADGSYSFE
jgi:hypothetical protein